MKLYTEEQIRKAMNDYANTSSDLDNVMDVEMAIIEKLTPIELPSDEEIERAAINQNENISRYYTYGFLDSAKWMKEQIFNQNK